MPLRNSPWLTSGCSARQQDAGGCRHRDPDLVVQYRVVISRCGSRLNLSKAMSMLGPDQGSGSVAAIRRNAHPGPAPRSGDKTRRARLVFIDPP
jgi:hypothetical protein